MKGRKMARDEFSEDTRSDFEIAADEDEEEFRERNGLEDDDDYVAWQKGENWD
jgi:hypothetical protein